MQQIRGIVEYYEWSSICITKYSYGFTRLHTELRSVSSVTRGVRMGCGDENGKQMPPFHCTAQTIEERFDLISFLTRFFLTRIHVNSEIAGKTIENIANGNRFECWTSDRMWTTRSFKVDVEFWIKASGEKRVFTKRQNTEFTGHKLVGFEVISKMIR